MAKLDQSPPLPLSINVPEAIKIYPALNLWAAEMERLIANYEDIDRLFRQHFLNIFKRADSLLPAYDQKLATLIRLYNLALPGNMIVEPLLRLEHNNSRAALACDMLAIMLKL